MRVYDMVDMVKKVRLVSSKFTCVSLLALKGR